MPESLVFVCSFDRSGNIRDRRSSIAVQLNDANDRIERGEGIRRHLWDAPRGEFAEQGYFPALG